MAHDARVGNPRWISRVSFGVGPARDVETSVSQTSVSPAVMSAGVATVLAVLVRALVVVVPPHDGVLGSGSLLAAAAAAAAAAVVVVVAVVVPALFLAVLVPVARVAGGGVGGVPLPGARGEEVVVHRSDVRVLAAAAHAALGPDRSPSSMSAPPNAAADAPPRRARCEKRRDFLARVASKWPLGLAARPRVSRLARLLTLDK